MQPLAYDRFADLYTFGWRNLGSALRAYAWFYVPLALIAGLSATVTQPVGQFITSNIDVLAMFPALAFATKLARPAFKMVPSQVVGLSVIWVALNGSFQVFAYFFAELVHLSDGFLFLGILVFPIAWITTKLALAQPILLLRSPGATIFDAINASWDYVEGDTWWRIVALNIVILLPLVTVGFAARQSAHAYATALFMSALAIATSVWMQISLVAMASNTGVPEEHTDAVLA